MKPTVGRIVFYTNLGDADGKYPPEQQAAIITRVQEQVITANGQRDVVSLHVFYPTGQFDMADVPFSETYARGCWSWPHRA